MVDPSSLFPVCQLTSNEFGRFIAKTLCGKFCNYTKSNTLDESVSIGPHIWSLSARALYFSIIGSNYGPCPWGNPHWYFEKNWFKVSLHFVIHTPFINFTWFWKDTNWSMVVNNLFYLFLFYLMGRCGICLFQIYRKPKKEQIIEVILDQFR